MIDCIRNSIRNIMRKRLRTCLTVLGIGIGVLSVVVISIIGELGKYVLESELQSMGIGGISLRISNEKGTVNLKDDALLAVQQNEYVEAATPLFTKISNVTVRSKTSQCIVWGIDEDSAEVVSLELLHGRMINSSDINAQRAVCMVDEIFATERYRRTNIVGKQIEALVEGKSVKLEIVGVVASGGNILQSMMGDIVPTFLYLPYTTLSGQTSRGGIPQVVAKLSPDADETTAISSLIYSVLPYISAGDKVNVENLNAQKDKLNGILDAATLVLSAIGSISLLVAGISIMTVMLVTVNERTREIGIKKSIGASSKAIMLEFLVEALTLSLCGSIIGALSGVLLGFVGTSMLGLPMAVNPTSILCCMLFCVVMGVLFGVYPAMKAARLKPVEALRFD